MNPFSCHLCGLALRKSAVSQIVKDKPLKFCCQGCSMVYTMLLATAGVDDPLRFRQSDLYRQCVAAGVIPAGEVDLDRIHEREMQERVGSPNADGDGQAALDSPVTLVLDLMVDGMWCTACAWVIEKTVLRLDGVERADCHFSTDRLRCRYRPDRLAPDQIVGAVNRLGYTIRASDNGSTGHNLQRRELVRLTISGLLSANVMMLSWALYAGFFTNLPQDAVSKISLPIVCMATVVFVYGGGPMLRKAWFGLIHRSAGMETLVGLGAGCAFVYSLFNWLSGSIHLYFDTACMLICLVLLGKFLEQQAKGRVRRDLDGFFALQPAKVRLIADSAPMGRYVAIAQLGVGDRFAVETEEIVPADGQVAFGSATIDESSLSGEPKPIVANIGDAIKSGTRVIDGRVEAIARKVGEETMLGQMIAIMRRSLEQKSAFESRTDRLLKWFVPVIVLLAVATGLFGAMTGLSASEAVVRAVTVMVISCPCALGVAIPMAHLAGISLAGRRGILVREIEAFERADAVDCIVFDKTGTLTRGRWQLCQIDCEPGFDPETIVSWAAGLEQASDHEIGRAINAYARLKGISPTIMADPAVDPQGIAGRLNDENVRIGNREFAWDGASTRIEENESSPTSCVYIGIDGRPVATLRFGDTIRQSVPSMLDGLQRTLRSIHLISGDGDAATQAVARSVGLTAAAGGMMPADKAHYIDALTRQGHKVAMVGDGVNDAAAMTRSHLAVAVHSGSGLAQESAHITLVRGDPAQLADFFSLSRRINTKVIQNLWCAWIYNLISIPVAMSGLLSPLVAATAMLLSSLTVIGNTLLLVRRQ